jgi:hypothetical protein
MICFDIVVKSKPTTSRVAVCVAEQWAGGGFPSAMMQYLFATWSVCHTAGLSHRATQGAWIGRSNGRLTVASLPVLLRNPHRKTNVVELRVPCLVGRGSTKQQLLSFVIISKLLYHGRRRTQKARASQATECGDCGPYQVDRFDSRSCTFVACHRPAKLHQ